MKNADTSHRGAALPEVYTAPAPADGRPRPRRRSPPYALSVLAVALISALVPLAYLALITVVASAVWLYAVHATGLITGVMFGVVGLSLYLGPIAAGGDCRCLVSVVAVSDRPAHDPTIESVSPGAPFSPNGLPPS